MGLFAKTDEVTSLLGVEPCLMFTFVKLQELLSPPSSSLTLSGETFSLGTTEQANVVAYRYTSDHGV